MGRAMSAENWVKVGDRAPTGPSELSFPSVDTRTAYVADFPGEDARKTAHYMLRWVATTGEKGPSAKMGSATIAAQRNGGRCPACRTRLMSWYIGGRFPLGRNSLGRSEERPMGISLPIELKLERPMQRPRSPYGRCGVCEYVGTDVRLRAVCPACGTMQAGSCGLWPSPEFEELWDDIVLAWNHKRAEVATVVSAMYFEASVFDLIRWGTHWLDPELNWIGASFEEVGDKSERIWAYLLSIRSPKATDNALKRLFGANGKTMLYAILGDEAKAYWANYRRLADFRNEIVHRGRRVCYRTITDNQDHSMAERMLKASMYWIPTCWVVFSGLWNEYIHKPMLERKQNGSE
jgi:hypothetical protein